MSLQTPLARVRHLGSAKDGTHHWWMQRLTAIALVPLTVWAVVGVIRNAGADRAGIQAWMASPLDAALMILFLAVGIYHGQLGLQVVIEDYVHDERWKIGGLIAVKLGAALLGLVVCLAVLKLMLGG